LRESDAGQRVRGPLDVVEPGQRRIDDHGVQPQRRQMLGHGTVVEQLALPAQRRKPPVEHGDQAAVVVDQGDTHGHLRRMVETGTDGPRSLTPSQR
jgi:hypothetical protein